LSDSAQKEPIREILKAYPFQVKGIKMISYKGKKGVWSVLTDKGNKILKKSPAQKAGRVQFICKAVRHLRARGIELPAVIPTRSGSDFAERQGAFYVLSEAYRGKSPEYDNSSDLAAIMKAMGKFHKASKGFTYKGKAGQREHLGKWDKSYAKHLDELRNFKSLAAKKNSPFCKLFLRHADRFIAEGNKALNIIRGSAYTNWVRKVKSEKNICHQDFASGNLLKTKQSMAIIDTDSFTYDLPARDLRKILNKVMKKKGWNRAKTISMLRAYQSVHPLSADEYKVLYADLLFPYLFNGIGSKYFKGRTGDWNSAKTLEKLKLMVRAELSKNKVLDKWTGITNAVTRGKD
jgi:spore coat-associated protein S